MSSLFRPPPGSEDDLDLEDPDEIIDPGAYGRPLPDVPKFAVIVSEVSTDGWHMAAVIGQSANPDFYVRAVNVRWPFLIARPARSNRTVDKPVAPDSLSPTGTTPARKLVVNWGWVRVEESVSQLRFYVKRRARLLLRSPGAVKVRVTLKEVAWPQRRIVVAMTSNPIIWNPRARKTRASPPEQST